MKANAVKVSVVLLAFALLLPMSLSIWGTGGAVKIYENDGNVHSVIFRDYSIENIDGQIDSDWPSFTLVDHLWSTGEADPVGDVYIVHDEEMIFIGASATYPGSGMADDGHWIKIDWNSDGIIDYDDNMGNNEGSIFALSDGAFEYAIPLDHGMMEGDKLDILLHAEMVGLPSDPECETTTFPYRPPGKFLFTTLELAIEVPNQPPSAEIDYTADFMKVCFDGSASYDADGQIISYEWDFGDGATADGQSPTHIFVSEGTFDVTLKVTDNDGAFDIASVQITFINEPPVADAGEDHTVFIGSKVYLDGSASYDVDGDIKGYYWSFGDEEFGEGMQRSHLYLHPGTYEAALTVTDHYGATDTDHCLVTVLDMPALEYSVEYLNELDMTIVDQNGIHFWASGLYPERECGVLFNQTYVLPASDYGTYAMYNSTSPVHFKIRITNLDQAVVENVKVIAIQEFHNTVTVWDRYGEFQMVKGEPLDGSSAMMWTFDSLQPGQTIEMSGYHYFQGRGWGLDQTHLIVKMGNTAVIDDSEAGVYCPP